MPIFSKSSLRLFYCGLLWSLWGGAALAQLTGQLGAHDPSTIIFDNGRYYYFATGDLLAARSSANLTNWTAEAPVFDAVPTSVLNGVQEYQGESLWAPDVIKLGDQFYLYYSASTFGVKLSGIGLATSPTLDPDAPSYGWTDQGMVITSNHGSPYNAIDPSMLLDEDTGRLWMTWGSFNNGIYVKEMNPSTGQPLSGSPGVNVAAPGPTVEIEGAAMMQRGDHYYLFTNWGGCCSGVDSTYNIRVGRSNSPTGPFLDRDGVNMLNGGGTLFLDDDGSKIGPGHFSLTNINGQEKFSYHYYNGDALGAPTFALRDLYWTGDDWPSMAAIDVDWTGGLAGAWSDAANWSAGGVPQGVGNIANFEGQGTGRTQFQVSLGAGGHTVGTVNFRGVTRFVVGSNLGPTLTLDDIQGEAATLNVAEGTHTIAAPLVAVDPLQVHTALPTSVLNLGGDTTSPILTKYGEGELRLGGTNTVNGSVFVHKGSVQVTGSVTTQGFSSVGQLLGESASLSLSGTGSFTSNGDLNIGDSGDAFTPATGSLYLQDQASVAVDAGGFFVGSGFFANSRAEGLVVQTGGTLTVTNPADGAFVIGGRGSSNASGIYQLSGGTVNASTNAFVGGRGEGTVEQTGGTFNANSFVALGRFVGSTGEWTITEGTFNQTNTNTWLLVGEEGQGTLTINGDGTVSSSGVLQVGYRGSGTGTIHLNGGLLTARSIVGGDGSATLNFNGGVLQAAASSGNFLQGSLAPLVKAGGAILDTQANAVTIANTLLHDSALGSAIDGGLTKQGSGVLRLTAGNTYNGTTSIDQGTLLAANTTGSATGSGPVQVNSAATLAGSGTVAGHVSVNADGTLSPGTSAGVFTAQAGVTLAGNSLLDIEIGGLSTGTQYDQLAADSSIDILPDAILQLSLLTGFTPNFGDEFTIVTATNVSGTFDTVDGYDLGNGLGFDVVYGADNIALEVVLLGDYDSSGQVDAADYTVWRDDLGQVGTNLAADGNSDSVVDENDYILWKANFGGTSSPANVGIATVPEPRAMFVLLSFVVGWMSYGLGCRIGSAVQATCNVLEKNGNG